MADNTTLNPGAGGDVIATDDVAGIKHQLVKVEFGAADSATQVSAAAPLPTVQTGALPAGGNAIGSVSVSNFPATQPVSIAGTVTVDSELPAAAALADATANPTIPSAAALGLLFNGTTWDRVRGDITNGLDVDVTRLPALVAGAATIGNVNNVETIADNAGFTDGTSKVSPVGFIFDEVAGTALTENDVGAPRMDAKRATVGVIEDATTRGTRAAVLAASPGSDTGQAALAVRVISQLGAGAGGAGSAVSQVDKSGFTEGATTFNPIGGVLNDTISADPTEDQAAAARITPKRGVHVNLRSQAGVEQGLVASPVFARLSDGAAAYDATKTGQLPAALVGSRLDANVGAVGNAAPVAIDGAIGSSVPLLVSGRASTAIPTAMSADGDIQAPWLDRSGAMIVRKRPVVMYTAQYRLANATAATRRLQTAALTANTNKQVATIHHAVGATKRVQIKYIDVIFSVLATVAGLIEWEVVQLSAATAPATGNPAITPGKHDGADGAAEATCLALPTTAGSVVNADQPVGMSWLNDLGITGAVSTVNPIPAAQRIVLWDSTADGDGKDLIIRAATAEGFAINVRSTAASVVGYTACMIFTEE